MPAKPPHNGTSPTVLSGDPSPGLDAPGQQPAAVLGAPDSDATLSPADRVVAERTERRRQRTAARGKPAPAREPRHDGRRGRRAKPASQTPQTRLGLRNSVPVTLIPVLAAGAVLGAILGALSAPGVVIGLLVGGLTLGLAAALPRNS
jgi:hypothetical protein